MTKIFIDTASGTWGEVDGDSGRLLIVDIEQAAGLLDSETPDVWSVYAALDSMSDSEVVIFGDTYGHLAR